MRTEKNRNSLKTGHLRRYYGQPSLMQNKVLVADDRVSTCRYNLFDRATANAEHVLLIEDPELAARYGDYIDRLVGRYRGA